jgi:hypothetical protein
MKVIGHDGDPRDLVALLFRDLEGKIMKPRQAAAIDKSLPLVRDKDNVKVVPIESFLATSIAQATAARRLPTTVRDPSTRRRRRAAADMRANRSTNNEVRRRGERCLPSKVAQAAR